MQALIATPFNWRVSNTAPKDVKETLTAKLKTLQQASELQRAKNSQKSSIVKPENSVV